MPSDGQARITANRERMRVAMARQFETDADIATTIDAIMAGRFKGILVHGTVRYCEFRRPGLFNRTLNDGMVVNRFSHPDIRIARRNLGGYNWDGGLTGFDRETLARMFASGMVVQGGPGSKVADQHANGIRRQIASERAEEVKRLKETILDGADEERRHLLAMAFERLEPDGTLQAMHVLAAMNAVALSDALVNTDVSYSDHSVSSMDCATSSM